MLLATAMEYSNKLLAHDQNQPDFFEVLDVAVRDSSEYSTLMRVLGLYPLAIDAFVPARLPADYPRQRIANHVISGWHQVGHISSRSMPTAFQPYQMVPYEQLEMLPQNGDLHASMFNARGIGKHSERVESDIFIPMGVPQVGRMRQRGHHAVKFVGQAHFDDPHLFDRHFDFKSIHKSSD